MTAIVTRSTLLLDGEADVSLKESTPFGHKKAAFQATFWRAIRELILREKSSGRPSNGKRCEIGEHGCD
jgi:hypothetical protein